MITTKKDIIKKLESVLHILKMEDAVIKKLSEFYINIDFNEIPKDCFIEKHPNGNQTVCFEITYYNKQGDYYSMEV